MKINIILILLVAGTCFSCHQIYDPKTDHVQNTLVVQGMITDEAGAYSVKLSTSVPYDSSGNYPAVVNANVNISDDCGNTYQLSDAGNGVYVSNPAELIGQPGKTYTLHIKTSDGETYESEPQTMLPNDFNSEIYAEKTSQDKLIEDSYGQVTKVTVDGYELLVDISNNTDTLPRFRFTSSVTVEYSYTIMVSPFISYVYYCWNTNTPNDLENITDEKYQTTSTDIKKHSLDFLPINHYYTTDYIDSVTKKDSLIEAGIINQIISLKRYRINNETYQYYKDINLLLSAQGKLFDPIAFQIKGNIVCKSNPQKQAFGFFEASSVRTNIVYMKPWLPEVKTLTSFNPNPLSGCVGGAGSMSPPSTPSAPDFWVY